jgi:hypothetical protein
MNDVYERVLELMGKTANGRLYEKFVHDLGETPEVQLKKAQITEYTFPNAGFHLSCVDGLAHAKGTGSSGFTAAYFSLDKGYKGNLPKDIDVVDTPDDIERKLGVKAISPIRHANNAKAGTDFLIQDYHLKPVRLSVIFRGSPLKLNMVAVNYCPTGDAR